MLGPVCVEKPGTRLHGLSREGPARLARRVDLPGPVWAPLTELRGSHSGFPRGARFAAQTGPRWDPCGCVGWVV